VVSELHAAIIFRIRVYRFTCVHIFTLDYLSLIKTELRELKGNLGIMKTSFLCLPTGSSEPPCGSHMTSCVGACSFPVPLCSSPLTVYVKSELMNEGCLFMELGTNRPQPRTSTFSFRVCVRSAACTTDKHAPRSNGLCNPPDLETNSTAAPFALQPDRCLLEAGAILSLSASVFSFTPPGNCPQISHNRVPEQSQVVIHRRPISLCYVQQWSGTWGMCTPGGTRRR
jgi:hypothetical protein